MRQVETLASDEQVTERIGGVNVTFAGARGHEFDMTDGQFLTAIQRRDLVAAGTRVRVTHYDDHRTWFEILEVRKVEAAA